ncbi:MAG TPA: hypothetical protein VFB63_15200, partial [Bryobacteraceae bacterium]|nr:hypothetical protein [Bryobacteraceae bacterium]
SMLAAISSSLYAVDGVVLIDQKLARAGNVSPGDTPGFPVTISQPGSYNGDSHHRRQCHSRLEWF